MTLGSAQRSWSGSLVRARASNPSWQVRSEARTCQLGEAMEERSDRSSLPRHLCKYTHFQNPATSPPLSPVSYFIVSCMPKGVPEHCSRRVYRNTVPDRCTAVRVPGSEVGNSVPGACTGTLFLRCSLAANVRFFGGWLVRTKEGCTGTVFRYTLLAPR